MNKSESITALAAALCKAQGEMSAVPFDSTNPFLKNRFASLGAIIEHSRPILVKHGLSICQLPIIENVKAQDYEKHIQAMQEAAIAWRKKNPDKEDAQFSVPTILVGIESMLMHESGEWISERILLPLTDEKGKSLAQVAGSVTTYLKRYSWASLLGIYSEEDTDGNGHGESTKTIVKPQPKPAAPETDEQKLARFLKLFVNLKPYATEVFRRNGLVLDTEGYDAISASKVASFKKANVDALLLEVWNESGASEEAPEALPPEIANIIVPIPRKGMKRDEYLKHPDTIGSLYEAARDDEEAARRLFGLVSNYQPAPWVGRDGKQRPPGQTDLKFREALDRFAEWREQHGDK